MDFFYPNWINDFWRILGLIHYNDKAHFEVEGEKRFDRLRIMEFAKEKGLAFFDTASKVRRLKDNASDKFLEILEPTDIGVLLSKMPSCRQLITTGGKASEELLSQLSSEAESNGEKTPLMPAIGSYSVVRAYGREIRWWRMPSSSRAYPLALTKKAEYYKKLFE
jgi:G:T/U-mismatch repair DNA glycosylase